MGHEDNHEYASTGCIVSFVNDAERLTRFQREAKELPDSAVESGRMTDRANSQTSGFGGIIPPMSTDTLSATLAPIALPDPDGQEVRLGTLWEERPAVLVFLRHYG